MRPSILLVMALATALAFPADARVRITCEDGGGAVARGNGRRADTTSMCDVDRTCDGVCTFAVPGDCVQARLRLSFYSPGGYEVSCDPDEFQAPCPSSIPVFAIPVSDEGVERRRRAFQYKNDRFFVVDLVCTANRSCTPPPDPQPAPDLTGNWIIVESAVTTDCPPDLSSLRSSQHRPPYDLRIDQQGDALRACAANTVAFGPGTVTGNEFRIAADHPSQVVRRHLSGNLEGLPDRVPVTDVLTVYGSSGLLVCTKTTTGIMARTDAACSLHGECPACSRCVRGRCRRIADCRYSYRYGE